MPTKDPVKNRQYVKKSQERRKAEVGVAQFNKEHTQAQMKHKEKLKATDIDKFRKEQAEYMKEYMKQRRLKAKQAEPGKIQTKAINSLTDAIRARKARQELLNRAIEKANRTANDLYTMYSIDNNRIMSESDPVKAFYVQKQIWQKNCRIYNSGCK